MNETSIEKAVMDIITEVDLQEKTDVAAKKLSGGQKRKLSVGIALIGDPKIIFLGMYFMHIKYFLIGYYRVSHSIGLKVILIW